MFDALCRLYAFNQHYCHSLLSDVPEEKMAFQPSPGINTSAWILGHLAICTDFAARILGGPIACPRDWHQRFGPGSTPGASAEPAPPMRELVAAYDAGHERVTSLLPGADSAALAQPHNVDILSGTPIRTVGELLAHLMTTHESMHLGQLSMWRRLMGYSPLF